MPIPFTVILTVPNKYPFIGIMEAECSLLKNLRFQGNRVRLEAEYNRAREWLHLVVGHRFHSLDVFKQGFKCDF